MATLTFGHGNANEFHTYFTVEHNITGKGAAQLTDECLGIAKLHVADVVSVTVTKSVLNGKNGRVYVAVAKPDKPAKPAADKPAANKPAAAVATVTAEQEAAMLVEYGVAPDMAAALAMVNAKRDARRKEAAKLQDNVTALNATIAKLEAELTATIAKRDAALATIAELSRKA
jgi:hypothetical protein